ALHRYLFHLSSYNKIARAAPTWAQDFETNLYKLIITQSNKAFLLDVQADDLTEVDIAGLEAEAVAATAAVVPIPTPAPVPGATNAPVPVPAANSPAPVFPLPGSRAAAAAVESRKHV
ncbi:hypothetical protein BT96DRAFT_1074981, partial [Gymnopus androsaceus JB14]